MSLEELIPAVAVPEGQSGDWRVERFEITDETARLDSIRSMFRIGGRGVRPGRYTRLMRAGHLVMSDTHDEKRDHAGFVRAAKGDVLIHGLGLGMGLGAVLAKPDVNSVVVVEKSPDVISLVAPHYDDPRVIVICDDALTWQPPRSAHYGAVWHDIWDDICADNLDDMKRLHRRFGRRADWQGSWARGLCERYAA